MRIAIIALILVAGAIAHTSEMHDIWTTWKGKHGKVYADASDEAHRLSVFIATYERIQAWNAAGNTAVLAVNKFSDLSNEEFGALYTGAFPAPQSVVDANLASFTNVGDTPTTWDWRTKGAVTPIKNQGQCGSCWAFSTVASCESLWFINGNTLTSYSEQQIVSCNTGTNQGCNGGYPYLAMQYVAKEGLETEADYPYTATNGKCTYDASKATTGIDTGSSFVTPKNPGDLETAIYSQPIVVLVEADQDVFQSYSSGIIGAGCGAATDHAITAIGYDADSFIIKNSWGTDWGNQGYVQISSSTSFNGGLGACGVLSQPQFPKGLKSL
jgi:C1A family cysteine protease